jgi:hypothetical protein
MLSDLIIFNFLPNFVVENQDIYYLSIVYWREKSVSFTITHFLLLFFLLL